VGVLTMLNFDFLPYLYCHFVPPETSLGEGHTSPNLRFDHYTPIWFSASSALPA
jgi:hypothetical protein